MDTKENQKKTLVKALMNKLSAMEMPGNQMGGKPAPNTGLLKADPKIQAAVAEAKKMNKGNLATGIKAVAAKNQKPANPGGPMGGPPPNVQAAPPADATTPPPLPAQQPPNQVAAPVKKSPVALAAGAAQPAPPTEDQRKEQAKTEHTQRALVANNSVAPAPPPQDMQQVALKRQKATKKGGSFQARLDRARARAAQGTETA